jgi:4,4'-diapophytoene synthase
MVQNEQKKKTMKIDFWNLLKATSRTFYLSIRSLPSGMDASLGLAYLMLRVSDYLEDSGSLPRDEKIRLLHLWRKVIRGEVPAKELEQEIRKNPDPDEVDYQAAAAAGGILDQVHDLPSGVGRTIAHHVEAATLGMARWVERGPDIGTEADLDDYMHEVAGRVGYLSTEIFAFHSPLIRSRIDRMMPLARETGLALQTVNIIRGIRKDYDRGWIYVPRSFCLTVGISPHELFDPAHRDDALSVLNLLVEKAERHLEAALGYIMILPRRLHKVRLACIWPMLFAARTIALSRGNARILTGEVKISRTEIKRIIRHSSIMGWSNRWLSAYFLKLLNG